MAESSHHQQHHVYQEKRKVSSENLVVDEHFQGVSMGSRLVRNLGRRDRTTIVSPGPLEAHESAAESSSGFQGEHGNTRVAAVKSVVVTTTASSTQKVEPAGGGGVRVDVDNRDSSQNANLVAQQSVPRLLSPDTKSDSIRRGRSVSQNAEIGLGRIRSQQTAGMPVHESTVRLHDSYDKFRTKSGRFERQFSNRRSASTRIVPTALSRNEALGSSVHKVEEDDDVERVPVEPGRFFDALQGPELETLKENENELMLPRDERWPFLLRFPVSCFGVCMGLGSQVILWKSLALSTQLHFLHIPLRINFALWCLALLVFVPIFATYTLKVLFFFEAVRREFQHPVRVNFFFAPWVACMFLALGLPPKISRSIHPAVWCVFVAPLFVLELKIYGQWLSGGERRLSKVANACTHLSVVGNFVAALLAANVGWMEAAVFFWAVGVAHYGVLFVTLYQRLPTNTALPKELHPVFFMFVAAPSTASVAWMHISGRFDLVSRVVFFIALFLYASLVVRINMFRGIRFSIAWWAYTFPMTAAAIASIQYTTVADSRITRGLAIVLSFAASAIVLILFCCTLLNAIVWKNLFPNDLAIAIMAKKSKAGPNLGDVGKADDSSTDELRNDSLETLLKECEPLPKIMIQAFHHIIFKDHNSQPQLSSTLEDQGRLPTL